jgi:hypothetical protein
MRDLGELSLETFRGRLDEPFRIHTSDDVALDVALAEASALAEQPLPGGRVPFSLVFRGSGGAVLPQGTYRVRNEVLGSLELFLVPLEPDADGARYQAIFA